MDKGLTAKHLHKHEKVVWMSNRYACEKCGESYERNPPDPDHTVELDKPCERGDSKEVTYTCKKCENKVIVHWDIPHHFAQVI